MRPGAECSKTMIKIPKAEARQLGLKKKTVFRSCPSQRAKRRARRGKAQIAAGNLPGGDDKVLAGFEESSVMKSGYLWSAVTYDDAGSPTMAVIRDAESTLIMAEREDPIGERKLQFHVWNEEYFRSGTRMVCRTGTDLTQMTGVTDVVLPASQGPEGAGGGALAATAFNTAAGSEICPSIPTTSVDGTSVLRPHTKVKVLYEVDSALVAVEFGNSVSTAISYILDIVNIVAANYELQTGIAIENELFLDTRSGNALGHTYPDTKNAADALTNFRLRWATDPELKAKMDGYGVVSLLSGQNPNSGSGGRQTIGIARLDTACLKGQGYETLPSSISWLALARDKECAVSLIMHEMGHAFSAIHHDYTQSAVMHSLVGNYCSQSFLPVVRSQISGWANDHTDGVGCACAASTGPEVPVPEPEPAPAPQPVPEPMPEPVPEPVPLPVPEPVNPLADCSGLRRRACRFTLGCIRTRVGCQPNTENGAVCARIPRKKWCRKAGCLWGPAVASNPPVAALETAQRARRQRMGLAICQDFAMNSERTPTEGN